MSRLVVIVAGVAMTACGRGGAHDAPPSQPVQDRSAPARPPAFPWFAGDEAAAFAAARASHRGVMIDFTAAWAMPSAKLDKALAAASLQQPITDHFVPLRVDVSDGTDADHTLQARYHAETLPNVVFVAADGTVIGRIDRELEPSALAAAIQAASLAQAATVARREP